MTKQDKRFCGICAESGHTSAECPRLGTASHGTYAQVVEATAHWLYGMRDVREATVSECTRCVALEAEVAELQGILAGNGPRLRVAERSDIVLSERISEQQPITERNTERISERKRGRPASPLTKAERQRAYRERRA